ncbi:uncharacterized protein LOC134091470 isoform X6 [Sardina pilchardus]|uniref:uncharacterized protein LOC134091470 isoform X6 n=1 Tax=Sardina pilchardus TaxID=27697 RepID=UPI002E105D8A
MDLGLPFSSVCAETHQFGLRVMVKEEDIKEEEYDHMITCPEEEEKPFAEFHCETETDVTESPRFSYNEILQTTVKTEVKKEEEEEEEEEEEHHEHLLESLCPKSTSFQLCVGAVYHVPGRLTVPGSKNPGYVVTEEEITRRIQAENMSAHVFRALLGGRKENLPAIVKALPKKKKTRTTIFSALSEQEAKELANGFATRLALDVTADTVCDGVDAACADVTKCIRTPTYKATEDPRTA